MSGQSGPSAHERRQGQRRAALAYAMDGIIAGAETVRAYDLGAALLARAAGGPGGGSDGGAYGRSAPVVEVAV
ncbi:hypothetical protein GTY57_13910 [Streptomyces sp. SID5475]|nr:hypothetical protein [Streptomyces sp. SID5475]